MSSRSNSLNRSALRAYTKLDEETPATTTSTTTTTTTTNAGIMPTASSPRLTTVPNRYQQTQVGGALRPADADASMPGSAVQDNADTQSFSGSSAELEKPLFGPEKKPHVKPEVFQKMVSFSRRLSARSSSKTSSPTARSRAASTPSPAMAARIASPGKSVIDDTAFRETLKAGGFSKFQSRKGALADLISAISSGRISLADSAMQSLVWRHKDLLVKLMAGAIGDSEQPGYHDQVADQRGLYDAMVRNVSTVEQLQELIVAGNVADIDPDLQQFLLLVANLARSVADAKFAGQWPADGESPEG